MKQPIFVIRKSAFTRVFAYAIGHGVIPHPEGLYWGKFKSKQQFLDALETIKFDENGEALISTVMEMLNSHFCNCCVKHADELLLFYKRQISNNRSIKTQNPQ